MSFDVRRAVPEDAPRIRDLFGRTFGRAMSPEEWGWKYPQNPDGWIAFVAETEGKLVGHYGGWPLRAKVAGNERTIVSIGDVATDPSARLLGGRRNVFRSMAEAMFDALRADGVPFVFGFPNERALEVGARLMGYRAEFPVREIVYEVSPSAPRTGTPGEWAPEEYDALWSAIDRRLPTGLVRDRRRLNWRYHARPDRYYRFVTTASPAGLAGCGILSVSGEEALVVEAVAGTEEDVLALADALAGEARVLGARRLVFWRVSGGPLSAVAGAADRRRRPGGVERDAGFVFATVGFDGDLAGRFAAEAPMSAGIYDDR